MRHGRWASLLLLGSAFGLAPLQAQPFARLVADLNPGTEALDANSLPAQFSGFQAAGARALFLAYQRDGAQCGLWSSDGTPAGTLLLTDLCADPSETHPFSNAGAVASAGRISYYRDDHLRLWRSDGSPEGTYPLADSLRAPLSPPPLLTPDGGSLVFQGCTDADGCELWRTDGTRAGTRVLFALYPGAKGGDPRDFAFAAGRLFFVAGAAGEGAAIFEADLERRRVAGRASFPVGSVVGQLLPSTSQLLYFFLESSASGAFRVGSIPLRPGKEAGSVSERIEPVRGGPPDLRPKFHPPTYYGFTALANRLYFISSDSDSGIALWEGDGTRRGTRIVFSQNGDGPFRLGTLGGRLLFLFSADPNRCTLWSLVPGEAAPRDLVRMEGACRDFVEGTLSAFRGRAYFVLGDRQTGLVLWSADPVRGTPRRELDLCPGGCGEALPALRTLGESLFVADSQAGLWRLDGPGSEPLRLAAAGAPSFGTVSLDLALAEGRLFFQGYDPLHLLQPWVSNLTPRGTRIAALLGAFSAGSAPRPFVSLGERVVFGACAPQGAALFASDGGPPLQLGAAIPNCAFFPFYGVLPIGPLAYLQSFTESQSGIVRTDGTPEGTFALNAPGLGYVRQLGEIGGRLVFTADEADPAGIGTLAFWSSDGTLAGTRRLFQLPLGGSPTPADDPHELLLFIAQEPEPPFHYRLFASDGTEAGTHRLLRIQPEPLAFLRTARLAGRRYFFVDPLDEVERSELWSTDGTPEGTQVVDSAPGAVHPQNPADLAAFSGSLYYFADAEVESGKVSRRALFRSDGTPGSTSLVAFLAPPRELGYEVSAQPTVFQGRLYLFADDGAHGAELWASDGTPQGTRMLLDLRPGPLSSRIQGLTVASGRLFFSADDGATGAELWTSDGTPEGTHLVQDLAPGPLGSNPGPVALAGDQLLFAADDGRFGRELWSLPLAAGAACAPGPGVLCLQAGRFRVEASYRSGAGWAPAYASPLGEAGARFAFPGPEGLEAAVRLGGGERVPGAEPVFVAGLTTLEHLVTLTDGRTGLARRYANPPGSAGSVADLTAFPDAGGAAAKAEPLRDTEGLDPVAAKLSPSSCSPGPARLCLLGGRFQVEVTYGRPGGERSAPAHGLSEALGSFDLDPFARPGVAVKLVDGQAVNGRFWVFAGSLTQRPFTLKVTDTATGAVRSYANLPGRSRSVADTRAF